MEAIKMIDLFELNDIVNEAGVIVMPGQLRNTTTQLLLVYFLNKKVLYFYRII